MSELNEKDSIKNIFYPGYSNNEGVRLLPSVKLIKTPPDLLDRALFLQRPFYLDDIRERYAGFFENISGPCIYLPDDCSKHLPEDLKAVITEEQAQELISSEDKEGLILGPSDEKQISLLHYLQHSKKRFDHYFEWKKLVELLEENPVIQNFIAAISKIRSKIISILNEEGIPVINLKQGRSAFGASRHQRSDGWHQLAGNTDLACKFSKIHVSINDSENKSFRPHHIPDENCVPEMLIPLIEGVLTVAPNMRGAPTLNDLLKEIHPDCAVKILTDAISGCIAFQNKTGRQHADIRPYNILAAGGPSLTGPDEEYSGLLIDFESMTPSDDPAVLTHNSLYDEGTYYNIRRPRTDADAFAFSISLLEIYLGTEGMAKFLHEDLPAVSPALGEKKRTFNAPGVAKSFTQVYDPKKLIRAISWSGGRNITSKIIAETDGTTHHCITVDRHDFHYSVSDLLDSVAKHFVEHNPANEKQYVSTNYSDIQRAAEKIVRNVRIFDQADCPIILADQSARDFDRCVKFVRSCFESIEQTIIQYAKQQARRPVLYPQDFSKVQPELEKLLREKVFPEAKQIIPGQIADLLVKHLRLDHTSRPGLDYMFKQLSLYNRENESS